MEQKYSPADRVTVHPERSTHVEALRRSVLEIDGLAKSFGSVLVADGISFDVGEAEAFALLGPSGCGKTTTLRMVAGLEAPSAGRILLSGKDITPLQPHRRSIGFVFQDFALFPHLTVFENVAFGLRLKRMNGEEIRKRVALVLDTIRLPIAEFGHRLPSQLSGGQRQRVAIARTLVTEPTAVLFDEPLAALDRHLRDHMLIELKELQLRNRLSAIYVTHDQEAAMILADRIAVMNRGRIEQVGTPLEIYRRPRTRFVAEFLGDISFLPAVVVESKGSHTRLRIAGQTIVAGASDHREGTQVIAGFRPSDISLEPAAHAQDAIHATVTASHFTGLSFLVQLNTSSGLPLTARIEARSPPEVGSHVSVRTSPSHVVVLRS